MRLGDLIRGIDEVTVPEHALNLEITGLTADSRAVRSGFLFAALQGSRADGRDFIPDAVERGARVVLAPPGSAGAESSPPLLTAADPRRALARIAAAFARSQPQTIAAVTGTNGKTSVAHFARQLWNLLGHDAASIGTLGLCLNDETLKPGLTTPDPVDLHLELAELVNRGVDYAVIEASSHGLDQRRLDGVRVTAAGFTNLSRDHLDYHQTEQAYFAAKLRLFSELLPAQGTAVINADSKYFSDIKRTVAGPLLSYGRNTGDLHVSEAAPAGSGTHLVISALGQRIETQAPFIDGFQIENMLCAVGLALACGAGADELFACVPRLEEVPGRLQRVGTLSSGASVFVDYAHTPEALETVLTTLRSHTTENLIVVFGCGGDRDTGKRPLMGSIATRLADRVIVTDDNPRWEKPSAIRSQVLAEAPGAIECADRAQAIDMGVSLLRQGDILIVAGKGHETGQVIAGEVLPFDDAEVARKAIVANAGGEQ